MGEDGAASERVLCLRVLLLQRLPELLKMVVDALLRVVGEQH
jgi:hypothetical protein